MKIGDWWKGSLDWVIRGSLPKQGAFWVRRGESEEANHGKIGGTVFWAEETVREVRCES